MRSLRAAVHVTFFPASMCSVLVNSKHLNIKFHGHSSARSVSIIAVFIVLILLPFLFLLKGIDEAKVKVTRQYWVSTVFIYFCEHIQKFSLIGLSTSNPMP